MAAMMAVNGGMLRSLCFLASFPRRELRLTSFGGFPSLAASWSSMRALAMSAQHRRKRSLSGMASTFFFVPADEAVVVVTVAVAMAVWCRG
jgi:uncharacterized membrane protein YbaN (DUF454 family)